MRICVITVELPDESWDGALTERRCQDIFDEAFPYLRMGTLRVVSVIEGGQRSDQKPPSAQSER